jgi:hypothetical protein
MLNTRIDDSGNYPIIVTDPAGPYFARPTNPDPTNPDEEYDFPWVVIHEPTGEHVATGTQETADAVVRTMNSAAV